MLSKRIDLKAALMILLVLSTTTAIAQNVFSQEESPILTDDFERASASKYMTSGETVQLSPYFPYQGKYCGRCWTNGDGDVERAYYYYDLAENLDTIYVKAYFYISEGLPLEDNNERFNLIGLFHDSDHVASVGVKRISGVDRFYQNSGVQSSSTSIYPRQRQYYCVEFYWERYAKQVKTWVDGKLLLSNTYKGSLSVNHVRIGISFAYGITHSLLIRADDLAIDYTREGTTPPSPPPNADIQVFVDRVKVVDSCDTSFGFVLDHYWNKWRSSSAWRKLTQDAGFKMIRIVDFKESSPHPCTRWYESSRKGTWDWTKVDSLVQRIFDAGAEPLITLGHTYRSGTLYPKGMALNPSTGLPYASSYAAYAAEWIKHFKSRGLPVRYYEIWNEPFTYFGWSPVSNKLRYFVDFWNTVARAMRTANPDIMISNDFITAKKVLNYWIDHGDDVDFLDFHKYDAQATSGSGSYDDKSVLKRLRARRFEDDSSHYGVDHARQIWRNSRGGKTLPVICSEANLNSGYEYGTDSRIQKVFGAVWTAVMLKTSVEYHVQYTAYYCFASSKRSSATLPTGGYGFGLINSDDSGPWYPYYVHEILGNNLDVGDSIVKVTISSSEVSALAWIHEGKLNLLLICEVDYKRTVALGGMQGQLRVFKIDSAIPYSTPSVQNAEMDSDAVITMDGYTVMLLQET